MHFFSFVHTLQGNINPALSTPFFNMFLELRGLGQIVVNRPQFALAARPLGTSMQF